HDLDTELLVALRARRASLRLSLLLLLCLVGRRSDRQYIADRLDSVLLTVLVDERHHHFARRSSSACAKYARRLAEDLVGPPQLTVFALELLEPLTLLARQTRPLPRIPLAPPNPAAQRLGRTADLLCDRLDRRPFRFILVSVITDQPNRPLPHLRRVLLCSCHGSNFSRVGASGKPGAIQTGFRHGSGNVFATLDLSESQEMLVKAWLAESIGDAIPRRTSTHGETGGKVRSPHQRPVG